MANIRSAKKRARQALPRQARNAAQRSMLRSTLRKVIKAIEGKNAAVALTAFGEMVPVLDRYATKGLIHKNKAARHKSRLAGRIKSLG